VTNKVTACTQNRRSRSIVIPVHLLILIQSCI